MEAPESIEQLAYICKALEPTPVLYNMVQGGTGPKISAVKARELGVRIVIYPALCLGTVVEAVTGAMQRLKETGDVDRAEGMKIADVFRVCGMDELVEFDRAAGGEGYNDGV